MPDEQDSAGEEEDITQAQLDSFADKLTEWGKGLSAAEQTLLNVVLARAGAEAPEVEGFQFNMGFGISAQSFLGPLVSSNAISMSPPAGDRWLEAGPAWPKSAGSYRA